MTQAPPGEANPKTQAPGWKDRNGYKILPGTTKNLPEIGGPTTIRLPLEQGRTETIAPPIKTPPLIIKISRSSVRYLEVINLV